MLYYIKYIKCVERLRSERSICHYYNVFCFDVDIFRVYVLLFFIYSLSRSQVILKRIDTRVNFVVVFLNGV